MLRGHHKSRGYSNRSGTEYIQIDTSKLDISIPDLGVTPRLRPEQIALITAPYEVSLTPGEVFQILRGNYPH
jgi:hypothetical protein